MNQANQKKRLGHSVHTFERQALLLLFLSRLLCHPLITRLKDEVYPEKHTKMQHDRELSVINYNQGHVDDELLFDSSDERVRFS